MTATFPSTGDFPSRPDALAREELDAVYLELRRSYKGLMVSRGQYRSKAERNRAAMQQLEAKLREIANREAAVRHEAYEMLEIVTKVVGELEDAGDDLVNEFGLYQKGRRTLQGASFIGRLIQAVIRFVGRWTTTKQNLQVIVEKQQAIQTALNEQSDGTTR
jgi:Arc/MetJ-type ribon-helix-helix transcriptional regulator